MTLNLPPGFLLLYSVLLFVYSCIRTSSALYTPTLSDACCLNRGNRKKKKKKKKSCVIRSDTHTQACPRDGRPPAATGNTRCPSAAPRPEAGAARASSEGWSCLWSASALQGDGEGKVKTSSTVPLMLATQPAGLGGLTLVIQSYRSVVGGVHFTTRQTNSLSRSKHFVFRGCVLAPGVSISLTLGCIAVWTWSDRSIIGSWQPPQHLYPNLEDCWSFSCTESWANTRLTLLLFVGRRSGDQQRPNILRYFGFHEVIGKRELDRTHAACEICHTTKKCFGIMRNLRNNIILVFTLDYTSFTAPQISR